MNKAIYIILMLLSSILMGCQQDLPDQASYIEEEFVLFYQKFIDEAEVRESDLDEFNLVIEFADLSSMPGGRVNGVCSSPSGSRNRTVRIDREKWKIKTIAEKEILIFHELGHCILDLDHDSSTITKVVNEGRTTWKDVPGSIMASLTLQDHFYLENRVFYLDQLFIYDGIVIENYVETNNDFDYDYYRDYLDNLEESFSITARVKEDNYEGCIHTRWH